MKLTLITTGLFFLTQFCFGQIDFEENIIVDDSNIVNPPNAEDVNSIDTGDIDGDGDIDIITGANKIVWYENLDGLGNFGAQRIINPSGQALKVLLKDIDNDGDLDIFSPGNWYENLDGLGNFGPEQNITNSDNVSLYFDAADIDNDGDVDFIGSIRSTLSENSLSTLYKNDGNGNFERSSSNGISYDGEVKSITLSDMDNDDDIDLLIYTDNNRINSFENVDGLGSFEAGQLAYPRSRNYDCGKIFAVDIDRDNDKDIIFSSDDLLYLQKRDSFFNNGFVDITISNNTGGYAYPVDIDNDGDIDIISTLSEENKIVWYENLDSRREGSVTFRRQQKEIANNVIGASTIFSADINGDGKSDIISYASEERKLSWYENFGTKNNKITGSISYDIDSNGCSDNNTKAPNILLNFDNGVNTLSTFSSNNGFFDTGFYQAFLEEEGNYSISIASKLPNHFVSNPTIDNVNFEGVGNAFRADFCIEPNAIINDISVKIYPITDPRPGSNYTYRIVYKNTGTTILKGILNYIYDFDMNFLSSSRGFPFFTEDDRFINDGVPLGFTFSDLKPFEVRSVDLTFWDPREQLNIGDKLSSFATVDLRTEDNITIPNDNVYKLDQIVVDSYEPNNIRVLEGESIYINQVDDYLHYIIRFQNTGTASVININVENKLDDNLDWSTIELEGLSHEGTVEITNGNMINFIFKNIELPDSTTDEPNSHGFIIYKIKPKNDSKIGDVFENSANVYFDTNPPIITNTVVTEIITEPVLAVNEFEISEISVYPNPTTDILVVNSKVLIDEYLVYDTSGKELLQSIEKSSEINIDAKKFPNGIYFLELKHNEERKVIKFVKQ